MTDLLVIYVAIKHNNSIIKYTFYLYHLSDSFKIWYKKQFRYGCATDENVYFRLDIKLHKIGCVIKPELKKSY